MVRIRLYEQPANSSLVKLNCKLQSQFAKHTVLSSSWSRTPDFHSGNHGFESRWDYQNIAEWSSGQLTGLITRRSGVRIPSPPPMECRCTINTPAHDTSVHAVQHMLPITRGQLFNSAEYPKAKGAGGWSTTRGCCITDNSSKTADKRYGGPRQLE